VIAYRAAWVMEAQRSRLQRLSSLRGQELFAAGLERMRASGAPRGDADPALLATALMTAVQGGYLLVRAAHDGTPMKSRHLV
jgi:hypothetical protein